MTRLLDLQAEFAGYLLSRPGPYVPPALKQFVSSGTNGIEKRFAVYKNNVYARLVEALRDTFPAVERLVGEEFFRYAAVEYASSHPPTLPTLLGYGGSFPHFLVSFPAAESVPYLADVARLELLWLEAYHSLDASAAFHTSQAFVDDDFRPTLHPSARLMTSPYQTSRIWELNRNEASIENISLPQLREYLLVIRPERQVEVRRLGLPAYAALSAFAHGASAAQARDEAKWVDETFEFNTHMSVLAMAGTFAQSPKKGSVEP